MKINADEHRENLKLPDWQSALHFTYEMCTKKQTKKAPWRDTNCETNISERPTWPLNEYQGYCRTEVLYQWASGPSYDSCSRAIVATVRQPFHRAIADTVRELYHRATGTTVQVLLQPGYESCMTELLGPQYVSYIWQSSWGHSMRAIIWQSYWGYSMRAIWQQLGPQYESYMTATWATVWELYMTELLGPQYESYIWQSYLGHSVRAIYDRATWATEESYIWELFGPQHESYIWQSSWGHRRELYMTELLGPQCESYMTATGATVTVYELYHRATGATIWELYHRATGATVGEQYRRATGVTSSELYVRATGVKLWELSQSYWGHSISYITELPGSQ